MWICINMQKSGYFIYLFWRYGWLKNPAVWLAEDILAHISGHFPQIWDLCTNIANNIHVHYRTNSVKIRQKFSISSKGPVFGLFSILVVEIFFLENQALSHTTSYGFLASCQNLEKTNDTIPRKCPDRQKGEW